MKGFLSNAWGKAFSRTATRANTAIGSSREGFSLLLPIARSREFSLLCAFCDASGECLS